MTDPLDGVDAVVCDLDGVVYRGDAVVDGAPQALDRMRTRGIKIVFSTNNSRLTVGEYRAKLRGFGIDAPDRDIVTSAVVTGEVLSARDAAGARALVVGGDGIRAALSEAGVVVVDDPDATPDLVIVGLDTSFTYEKMKRAAQAVSDGARLIATNDDAALPVSSGQMWPGAGALVAAIEVASGARAEVMGKPHPPMLDAVEARLGAGARVAVVGDREETDLRGARDRGWKTILVLSGVTDARTAASLRPPPDHIARSIAELA